MTISTIPVPIPIPVLMSVVAAVSITHTQCAVFQLVVSDYPLVPFKLQISKIQNKMNRLDHYNRFIHCASEIDSAGYTKYYTL